MNPAQPTPWADRPIFGRPGPSALRPVLATLVALAAALVFAGASAAATLAQRLDRALAGSGVAASATGAFALDLSTGKAVYGRNPNAGLIPASNEKLVVTFAVLDELGPGYRIPTRVLGHGRLEGRVWHGRLVLKGYGDPTLDGADLRTLAREVAQRGIRRVTGGIVADESYFDARRTAPGWKPYFYKLYCPPISALVVSRALVGGRTVDDPALAAGRSFRQALIAQGVGVAGGVRRGVAGAKAVRLADVYSPRMSSLVRLMNRPSDNFVAEMLLKKVGARQVGKGTTAAGARVARQALAERAVPLGGVRIVDGSGLSRGNRLTARAAVSLLVAAWTDTRMSAPFFASLPTAGVNGTLRQRMRSGPAYGRVRAKTGTTRNASALSGYVRTKYVFSVLHNGNPVPTAGARRAQDRFAQVLAGA